MSEKLLTVAEAATTLRLHPVTLRALAAAGTVPAVKIGRAWRFVEIDLLAWARAHYRRADAVGDKESTCRSTNVPDSRIWWATISLPDGGRVCRSSGTANRKEAQEWFDHCAPNSGASTVSANAPPTRGRTP